MTDEILSDEQERSLRLAAEGSYEGMRAWGGRLAADRNALRARVEKLEAEATDLAHQVGDLAWEAASAEQRAEKLEAELDRQVAWQVRATAMLRQHRRALYLEARNVGLDTVEGKANMKWVERCDEIINDALRDASETETP